YIFDQRSRRIVLANRGLEEAKLRGLAYSQGEHAIRKLVAGSLLHSERRDGQSLERSTESRDRRHRGFDSDGLPWRNATPDAGTFALPGQAVISRAAGDGVHQILADQRSHRMRQPAVENFENPFANQIGTENAAVEKNMRRSRALTMKKISEMPRDRGVGC